MIAVKVVIHMTTHMLQGQKENTSLDQVLDGQKSMVVFVRHLG